MIGHHQPRYVLLVTVSLLFLGLLLACNRAEALPRNTRQVPEGYWLGGIPSGDDIEELHARGVRLVLSAVRLDRATLEACERIGVTQVYVRFGSTFRVGPAVLSAIEGYSPEEIFIHCDHGGDRAGAILAFVLVLRDDWAPDHALLAVAFPGRDDLRRMISLLEGRGLIISAEEREQYAGIYSGASNGGHGGLKVRGDRYVNLVTTTLDALSEHGVELYEALPVAVNPTESVVESPEEVPQSSP